MCVPKLLFLISNDKIVQILGIPCLFSEKNQITVDGSVHVGNNLLML
jgi:hypothetical protein